MIPLTAVMIYPSRDSAEIESVLDLLRLSYDFARGKLERINSIVV